MKNICLRKILLVIACLSSVMAYSKVLTPEEAMQRVSDDKSSILKAPAFKRSLLVKTVNSPNEQPAVYLFGNESGDWIAVSANDVATPLLGYGVNSTSDAGIPPQMEWWLNEYSRRIQWSDSIAESNSSDRLKMRNASRQIPARARTDKKQIQPLLSTKWDQGNPYNMYTPVVNGVKTPTGCVATALCQVMNYHQYPDAGHGIGVASTETGQTQTMNLNTPLRWESMKDTYYRDDYSADEADAVATLMKSVGYACQMNYGEMASGAYDIDANKAMVENFDYAPSTWLYYRDNYTIEEWEDMLYKQLSEVGPLYYSGATEDAGHAFVCDGYEGEGYFHFNWGWGGWYDGMFLIDALEPEGIGTGGSIGGFNYNQLAMLGMQRPGADTVMPTPQLSQTVSVTGSIDEEQYPCLNGRWENGTYKTLSLSLGFEISNMTTGNADIYPVYTVEALDPYYGFSSLPVYVDESLEDGNYKIRLMTRLAGDSRWLPALTPPSMEEYGYFTMNRGVWGIYEEKPLTVVEGHAETRLFANEPSSYTIVLQNHNNVTTAGDYGLYLCREIDNNLYIVGKTEREFETFAVAPNSTEKFEAQFTFSNFYEGFEFDTQLYLILANPHTLHIEYFFDDVTVCRNQPIILAEEVSVVPDEWRGTEGDQIQLEVRVLPENASNKNVVWSSSDPEVASVDENGLVSLLSEGSCVITAETTDGSDLTADCLVSVDALLKPLNIIGCQADSRLFAYEPSTYTITLENTNNVVTSGAYSLYLCKEGGDGYFYIVGETESEYDTFEVAPKSTETFEKEFTFTKFYEGFELDAELYLVLVDPVAFKIVDFFDNVTVGYHEPTVLAEQIYLSPDECNVEVGDMIQLSVTILPEEATCKDVEWSSGSPEVAIVDGNGLVEIKSPGECVITAATMDGSDLKAECIISVTTSVDTLTDGRMTVDVYAPDGREIMRNATSEQTRSLAAGIYIVRYGSNSRTIIKTNRD